MSARRLCDERPLTHYLPAWQGARSPLARRVVAYAAAANGDLACAGYFAACFDERTEDRVGRVIREALS